MPIGERLGLRPVNVALGRSTEVVLYAADRFIAGLSFENVDPALRARFEEALTRLGWAPARVRLPLRRQLGPRPAHELILFEAKGPKSAAKSVALATLRNGFGFTFGPAIFDRKQQDFSSLRNHMTVGFSRTLDAKTAEAILRRTGAVTIHPLPGLGSQLRAYRVVYSPELGVEMFAIGQQLVREVDAQLVEYEMFAVETLDR
jgi:hypothetical protein